MTVNMDVYNYVMSKSVTWGAVSLISELQTLLEFSDMPNEDLWEINKSLSRVKQLLSKYLHQRPNITAYDVCLQGIKEVLLKLKMKLTDFDFVENKKKEKTSILRLDILLIHRSEQFEVMFPIVNNSVVVPDASSLIQSKDGKEFWDYNFEGELMVYWNTFYKVYCTNIANATYLPSDEQMKLRNFLDFTRDGFVTPYEFGLFLRWFGPLKFSQIRLSDSINTGIMAGFIPAFEAESVLADSIPGSFLFRISKSNLTAFALAIVGNDGKVKHTLIETNQKQDGSLLIANTLYNSLSEFAKSMNKKLIYPGRHCWMGCEEDDVELVVETNDHLVDVRVDTIKEKKNSIFSPKNGLFGDSCIVCLINPLQTVFLECGHISCCKSCAANLAFCPMCKKKITRVVEIKKKCQKPANEESIPLSSLN